MATIETTDPAVRRILVTGSRRWTDTTIIATVLKSHFTPDVVLVSGACPHGADRIAETLWQGWGGRIERHPAEWNRHGRQAGFLRNQAMMVNTNPDLCVAFIHNNSPGASHTAHLAQRAGITTRIYRNN